MDSTTIDSSLLFKGEDGKQRFVHDSYLDYFAASTLADKINDGELSVRVVYLKYFTTNNNFNALSNPFIYHTVSMLDNKPYLNLMNLLIKGYGTIGVWMLGEIGRPEAVDYLVNSLTGGDRDPFIIEALGKIGTEKVIPTIEKYILDENTKDKSIAVKALANIGNATALTSLIKYWYIADTDGKTEIVNVLTNLGTKEAEYWLTHDLDGTKVDW
jgi:hypothetical protein